MLNINRFEIVGANSTRPDAEQILFCDGTGGRLFRADTDLELSHWRPNRTPAEYRGGTSTEICFRFLDNPRPGSWTVAVNNHVDVDGILSVYVLVHRDHALAHRELIIQAAEMGDFWSWGEPLAQRLFQGITYLMQSGDDKAVYSEVFQRIPSLIDGTDANTARIETSLEPLRRGIELVEQGTIERRLISDRLAHYIIPLSVAGDDDDRAAYCPDFNELISENALFWPQSRARWDAERSCLVSTERPGGWFHDLWFPGHMWADTEGLWRVPGLAYHDGMRSYDLDDPYLIATFEALQRDESALDNPGNWSLGGTSLPFGKELQSRFPLGGRFLTEQGQPGVSKLNPTNVAARFSI